MLILAREFQCMTQMELATEMAISQAEISKYETGFKIPTPEQATSLATKLRVPVEFFYQSESMRAFGSGCVYHRKRQSATESRLKYLLALVNIRRIHLRQLLMAAEMKSTFRFEHLDVEDFGGDASKVARALRDIWKLPPGPVQNVVRTIEDAGGVVMRCDFGTDKVDAISQWLPGMPPLFLVNQMIPTDRLRFTLVHEIGHIVMHRFPTESMEKEADQFAAEFLLPEKEVKPHLGYINLPKLASLKAYWRVSMNALLKRAGDLGTITERTRSYLWMQMGSKGYRKHEPVELPVEEPTLIYKLVHVHCDKLKFGPKEIAKLLHMHVNDAVSTYFPQGTTTLDKKDGSGRKGMFVVS
ncbi:MAG TPA: XRE family transcriptional regulator [Terriglobales bacterium]|nr:XRE family transcriptional regulator [Terriglobales bacterium]